MNFNNFNDLLVLLKKESIEQNESYKQHLRKQNDEILNGMFFEEYEESIKKALLYEITDSPQYLEVSEFLTWNFNNLSNDFKCKLIKFLNENFKQLFQEHWMHDFYIIRDAIMKNTELNYQYKKHHLPFGFKNSDKYNKRISTMVRRSKHTIKGTIVIPRLSPYESLKFFAIKTEDLMFTSLETMNQFYTVKRDKKKFLNDFIFDLVKIITCDNYKQDIKNKSNFRITKKHSRLYLNERKAYKDFVLNNLYSKHIGIRP